MGSSMAHLSEFILMGGISCKTVSDDGRVADGKQGRQNTVWKVLSRKSRREIVMTQH